MKSLKFHVACALSLAVLSSQAYAISPFDAPDANGVTGPIEVYLSGASAPQHILTSVATQMFDPGFIVYYDDGGTAGTMDSNDGKHYRAYYGKVKNNAALYPGIAGKLVRLQHRAKGGSAYGVEPVASSQHLAAMKISSGTCTQNTTGTAGTYAWACQEKGTDFVPSADTRVPDMGVSDVEPTMFVGVNTEIPGANAPSTHLLDWQGTNGVLFAPAVTTSITMASLKSADVAAMMDGDIQDWTLVDASAAPAAGTNVVMCRRTQGSGTQASYNQHFLHFPCSSNQGGSILPTEAANSASMFLGTTGTGTATDPFLLNPADGYTVVENSASGDVRTCLQKAQTGGNMTFRAGGDGKYYKVDFGTGGYGAVGVLSLDSAGSENGWSFRSLDGIAPTKTNAREVAYDFVMEQTMQYRKSQPNGNVKSFMNAFRKQAGDPNVLNAIANVGVRNSVIALPINYDPTAHTNVMKGTRNGNSCSPIRKTF